MATPALDWSRRFPEPIAFGKGKPLRTLDDARRHAASLPRRDHTPAWHLAAEMLFKAAEHGGAYLLLARIAVATAIRST
jgi:hypothetical protein